jgi:Spy/CpxP family protein refolding chaperone
MGLALGIDPRDLTDAQREQLKAIRDRHAEDLKPTIERSQKAHQTLDNAVLTGVGDLRGLALEVGNAETELALQQAQIGTEIVAILTPEQKQKMQERRALMEQRRQSRGNSPGNAK